MPDREKVIKSIECCVVNHVRCFDDKDKLCPYFNTKVYMCEIELLKDALALLNEQEDTINELQNAYGYLQKQFFEAQDKLLKEQETKQYNSHEIACILADLFGDPCACNFNDIDTWLPYKCDFRETCCPNPVGVACWEQYLKHKEGR